MPSPLQVPIIGCGSIGEIKAQCFARINPVDIHGLTLMTGSTMLYDPPVLSQ